MGALGFTTKAAMQGLNIYGGVAQYKYEKENGKSPVGAITKTVAESALFAIAPTAGMVIMGGQLAAAGITGLASYAQNGGRRTANTVNNVYRNEIGGNYVDTQNAQTMRQRGLEAIQHSGNNLNQVFGSEARTYYRGMR